LARLLGSQSVFMIFPTPGCFFSPIPMIGRLAGTRVAKNGLFFATRGLFFAMDGLFFAMD